MDLRKRQSHKYTNNLYIYSVTVLRWYLEFLKVITSFETLDVSLNLLKIKPSITMQFSNEYTEVEKRKSMGQNLQGLQWSADSGCMRKYLGCCLVTRKRTFHNQTFSGNQNKEKTGTEELLTSQEERGGK